MKTYTKPLTDKERDEIWAEICTVPEEKIEFLLTCGSEEYKVRNQSRMTLRNRAQVLLVLLVTATTGAFLPTLYGTDTWQRVAFFMPGLVWTFCSGILFFYVQSRKFWSGFGSPIDNLKATENLKEAKLRKLFNLEESIIEMAIDNRELARAFNGCLIAALLGLAMGLITGFFSVFALPFF